MSRGGLFRAALLRYGQQALARLRYRQARQRAKSKTPEWIALRDAIGCCCRCGVTGPLTKDHIVPVYHGGGEDIENLQPLCKPCNEGKGMNRVDYRPSNWRELLTPGRGE